MRAGEHEMHTELVAAQLLRPHPRNYRQHPPDQLAHITRSIEAHGFYRAVVVARDNVIIAGHGLVEAARQLGIEQVPVVRLDIDALSPRALQILTGDNAIGQLAENDDRALTDLLREIHQAGDCAGDALLGTGFDASMLAGLVMVTRPLSEVLDIDAAREWVGLPQYEGAPAVKQKVRLTLTFDDVAACQELIKLLGVHAHTSAAGKLYVAAWPPDEKGDWSTLRFGALPAAAQREEPPP